MKKPSRRKEWFDDDSFWREMYPFLFPKSRLERTVEEIDKVLKLTSPQGKAALDLCCGPGRCAVALAKRGFSVTGIDRTKHFLNRARAKARAAGVNIKWIESDMRDFVRADAFDLVINMYTFFGYFDDPQEDLVVLHNILVSLSPEGKCLIEMVGKEPLSRIFQETGSNTLPDGRTLIQRRQVSDDWTRINNEYILIEADTAKHFRLQHTIYSGLELKERMARIGFVDVTLYGSLDGDPYGLDATRLIAVGSKEGR